MQCGIGKLAQTHIWGEHHSASLIAASAPDYGPNPVGKGVYLDEHNIPTYFYLQNFHDMDIKTPPDPAGLASTMAKLHRQAKSPTGLFGYSIVTGRGTLG